MNTNGKVRIYDLSRELNLDNRDILTVCNQLNISVKSHSSTITEAEAAQIRSAAEKYNGTNGNSSSHKQNSPAHHPSSQVKKSTVQPPVKKQQILEIRRQQPAEPPKRPDPDLRQPPAAPESAATPTPNRPVTRPNRPARPGGESPQVAAEAAPSESIASVAPAEIPVRESIPVQPAAELTTPPPRPVRAVDQPVGSNRPMLKRPRTETAEAEAPARSPMREGPVRPRPAAPDGEVVRPRPAIELRRKPVRPAGETAEGQPATAGTGGTAVAAPGDEKRVPLTLRPPKRAKTWEEEEEEENQQKAAAKAAAKGKRRVQVLDEDEDELVDEALNPDEDSPIQVSLSLERPAKPKSRVAQAKPVAVAVAAPVKGGSKTRETSRFRRDRRDQEVKEERPEKLILTGSLTVADLAKALVAPETEIIRTLFFKGIAANINQILDIPTATMVAQEMGVEVETGEVEAEARKVTEMLDAGDLENLQRRPPVVTIMGHVDHGKTTLLDSIRKTKVAAGEAGGITQHIGAYHVDMEHDGKMEQVVFLDTPGHEAFTAMRARGARVTDMAILVVAADDGVRPQTIEAISHAKAAEVPIIVAINKIDKEEAQPDRVKQELTEFGLVPEEWGGDTIMVPVSAIKGENLDTLLEMILLVSEVEDLYANPDRTAKGTVIEANLDKARGPVATLLIQNGTLRIGDVLVAGSAFGKVRAMVDDRGHRVEVAAPSFAVEVLGLSDVPAAGDDFEVYTDEREARAIASSRTDQQRQSRLQQAMASRRVSLNTLSAQAKEGELKELNLILKSDVQGSLEAILNALQQLPQREVQIRVLLSAPGEITETDVDLAAASDAVIVGFNTTLASGARQAADQAGVDVRDYNIIYKLLEDIQGAMEGLLEPEMVEEPLGQLEVRAVFTIGRGAVAGCYVQSGKAIRNCRIRVRRGGNVVHEGNLDSLKRVKDDVREVNAGYECGIGLDNFNAWEIGDIIETFRLVSKRRTLTA